MPHSRCPCTPSGAGQNTAPTIALRRADILTLAQYLDIDGAAVVERLSTLMNVMAAQCNTMAMLFATGAIVIGPATPVATPPPREATWASIIRSDYGSSLAPRLVLRTCEGENLRWMVYADLMPDDVAVTGPPTLVLDGSRSTSSRSMH